MRLQAIFLLFGLLAANGALAEAYTWTDEDGVIHFSDKPHPGAKLLDLGESKRPRPAARKQAATTAAVPTDSSTAEPAAPFRYESLEVASPAAEQTLWNIEGALTISLALTPALQPGHQVRAYFDGNARMVQGTSFEVEEVYRGVHNIQAEVLDASGKLMIRSRPNRFYVQQNTVIVR
jgi:hypothetical protein